MMISFQNKNPSFKGEQFSRKQSQKILNQCQKVIKQLQMQLQLALKKQSQKDQIIQMITQQKQFYETQYKKHDDKIYTKLKQQLSFNQSLIKGLKHHNKDLTQKNIKLTLQNNQIWKKVQQKDEILKMMQQKIDIIQKQKTKLEIQWSETLKLVKKKIFQIKKQSYCNNNQNNNFQMQDKIKKAQKRGSSRQNLKNPLRKDLNKQKYMNGQLKVREVLKQIDERLLNYEFLDMIQSTNLRKNVQNYNVDQSNKQNVNDQNYIKKLFNEQKLHKKVPILKLSQLCLNDNQC